MKITNEITDLSQYTPGHGARDTWNTIILAGKGEQFITELEQLYPDGIDDTALNDILRFDSGWCLSLVGLSDNDDDGDDDDE